MEKRKTSIELMRFLAAVMVVLVHIRQRVYPDNGLVELSMIIVDFFFMLTGFFTLGEVSPEENSGIAVEAHDAVLYSWNKAKGIFSLYIFAEALMFVIAPVCMVMIYAYIIQNYGTMDAGEAGRTEYVCLSAAFAGHSVLQTSDCPGQQHCGQYADFDSYPRFLCLDDDGPGKSPQTPHQIRPVIR